MDCNTPGFPVHHQLAELAQTHVHWVGDAIQPSHPLSSPSPPDFNLFQHQGLLQWVSSLHQVAKVLELQLQNQSFKWIFRTDFLFFFHIILFISPLFYMHIYELPKNNILCAILEILNTLGYSWRFKLADSSLRTFIGHLCALRK